jgi:hypothetical protein
MKVALLAVYRPPVNIAGLRLGEIHDESQHSYQDEPDAHQIVEDLGKNHHDYAKDKADDSSDEPQVSD